jgi:hypothetical protein
MSGAEAAAQHVAVLPGWREDRQWVLAVLLKRSYALRAGRPAERIASAMPLVSADRYWDGGDPERCSVQFETDLVPYKPRTDVVLAAHAHAPRGEPAAVVDVAVAVGAVRKQLRVTGDRRCAYRAGKAPLVSEPAPFRTLAIRYERAYGGRDERSDPGAVFHYPRNPIGCGVALRNESAQIAGLCLPNVEDPGDLLTPERIVLGEPGRWNEAPLPQGLGWYQRNWYPRSSFAGSLPPAVPLDRPLREEGLGLVPRGQVFLSRGFRLPGFDPRLNCGASLGLSLEGLHGDERVALTNLTPEGDFAFQLPGEQPALALDVGDGPGALTPVLQTVFIDAEARRLDLIWRGATDIPGIEWLAERPRLAAEVA